MRVVVLISGRGSNLEALIQAQSKASHRVVHVISDQADAAGLDIARSAHINFTVIDWQQRANAEARLHRLLRTVPHDLIVLAGFMRILSAAFLRQQPQHIINIHPSLLPLYPGLNTHARVLEDGRSEHGASVHLVNDVLDGGQVIAQTRIAVQSNDTPISLAARLLPKEHELLTAVVTLMANNRLRWVDKALYYDDNLLTEPITID